MFIWKPNSIQGLLHHLHAMWNQVESQHQKITKQGLTCVGSSASALHLQST